MAIFHDMIEKTIEVFMDDLLVFRNSFQSCLSHLEKMLKRCEDTNLCLNLEKSHFMVKEGIVLGHKISKEWIEVDKAKVDVITKLPHPITVKVLGKRQEKQFRPIHYARKIQRRDCSVGFYSSKSSHSKGSNTLSWKHCQGDSLNLPDHRYKRRCCSLILAESNSLPHAHAQTIKTKTFAISDIQDLPLRYQVYQGRLLESFQEDAKYEHVGTKIQDCNMAKTIKTNKENI
nr:reverse transcriptase domain-containing protein [Tanacetum cinerariifolium]